MFYSVRSARWEYDLINFMADEDVTDKQDYVNCQPTQMWALLSDALMPHLFIAWQQDVLESGMIAHLEEKIGALSIWAKSC